MLTTSGSAQGLSSPMSGTTHGSLPRFSAPSWTQTGVPFGIRLTSQTQSIAGTLTRTQPCDAG